MAILKKICLIRTFVNKLSVIMYGLFLGNYAMACELPHRESIERGDYLSRFQQNFDGYRDLIMREDWSALLRKLSEVEHAGYLEIALTNSVSAIINQSDYRDDFYPKDEIRRAETFYTPGYFTVRSITPLKGFIYEFDYKLDVQQSYRCHLDFYGEILKYWVNSENPDHYVMAAQLLSVGKLDSNQCMQFAKVQDNYCEAVSRDDVLLAYRRLSWINQHKNKVDLSNYSEKIEALVTSDCWNIKPKDLENIERDVDMKIEETYCD